MDRRTYLGIVAGGLGGSSGCTQWARDTGETETDEESAVTDTVGDDWPMFQVDAANTGSHPTARGPTGGVTERWRFETEGGVGTPTVVEGTVYVGTTTGTVYAIDERDGTEKWRFATEREVRGSLAVVDDTVYVRFGDTVVQAVDAETGVGQWRVPLKQDWEAVHNSPTLVGGTVYAASADVKAVDGETGTTQWSERDPAARVLHTPAVATDTVYLTSPLGHVYALDAGDGAQQWQYTPEKRDRNVSIPSSPTVADGSVFVGIRASSRKTTHTAEGRVYALSSGTGTKRWHVDTEYPVQSTVTDGSALYVGTKSPGHVPEGKIWAVEMADGGLRWRVALEDRVSDSLAVADGTVYVSSSDRSGRPHHVRALTTSDGTEQWRYELDTNDWPSSPAVVNNAVYLGGGSTVYALEESQGD